MNDRTGMLEPGPGGSGGNWLDSYMPESYPVPYREQPTQSSFIDMATIRGILFRQRWLIAGILVAAAIAGIVITLLATPMYSATSKVRIDPWGSYIVEGQDVERGVASNQVYDLLETQVGVITSRDLAKTVAENLNLAEREDFLGSDIDERRPPNLSDEEWHQNKQEIAASILHGSVSAEIPGRVWIIDISYVSADPRIAAEMANAYMDAFVDRDVRDSIENNEYAEEYLSEQIALIRRRLGEAEQAANTYARNSGIIMQPGAPDDDGATQTLTGTNLTNINARTSAARAARIEAEQRWRALQDLPPGQLSEVQSNGLLQGLIGQRTSKQAELAELRQRYYDAHPQVRSAMAQLETLDAQITQISNDIKSTARTQYIVARNQEEALQRELGSATGATLEEQDRQVEYSVLEREAQALRDQLAQLLDRYNQVSAATDVQRGIVNPLDSAVVPGSPYSPNLFKNLAIALVFGAALAGGLAVLRETLDDKVRSLDEVENKIGLPLLGHTPFVAESERDFEQPDRFSPLMEAYSSVRSTLEFSMPRGGNLLQLTSSQAGEGKSTTALILGELFASVGKRTLLVEADLRRPSLAKLVGHPKPKIGLVEVLAGEANLQSALISGVNSNLQILPVGQVAANPAEILASSQFREFFAMAREEFDLVIVDSPPMLGLADAPMTARLVDGTIFVMEANRVQLGQARSAIKRLRAGGGNPIGAILTKYRALEAGESYNYQYGYYEYASTT